MATLYGDVSAWLVADGAQKSNSAIYRVESTETKPDGSENDLCIEMDTGKVFYMSASAEDWKEVGYNA